MAGTSYASRKVHTRNRALADEANERGADSVSESSSGMHFELLKKLKNHVNVNQLENGGVGGMDKHGCNYYIYNR